MRLTRSTRHVASARTKPEKICCAAGRGLSCNQTELFQGNASLAEDFLNILVKAATLARTHFVRGNEFTHFGWLQDPRTKTAVLLNPFVITLPRQCAYGGPCSEHNTTQLQQCQFLQPTNTPSVPVCKLVV